MKKSREEHVRDGCKDTPSGLEVSELQTSGSWRVLWGSGGLCLLCLWGEFLRCLLRTIVRGRMQEQKAIWSDLVRSQ